MGADGPLGRASARARVTIGALLTVIGAALLWRFFVVSGVQPNESVNRTRSGLSPIARLAPSLRTIGCFHGQTGQWGYFASTVGPYRIVNLDGLVNNRVLESVRAGRYFEYLDSSSDVVVLNPPRPFEALLGARSVERFRARFPRWPEHPEIHGPRDDQASDPPGGHRR